ncbi:MAG TPA: CHASE4 domain-containing protein [Methanosarcina thermophila]|uniref:CHASE4 domain-containing protein n=1 Tax=Methanosarcina thermophila TaxID=2210 RepID=UPI0011E5E33E|nr:CHASE4 domain-containing protein [Methanosarcina thermophila]HOA68480.1 CHASE4 domain-containing protein [Methanosarcina thermophila]HPT80120.1 CHASE4 domain-containing protein [Methanosarcina thermophila]HPZ19828.1 CHASE4 domain-containing protein [Methanosarcina thermophila]HQD94218.1 CHASE4 domain-containing protein [Methanosarcina thermophila]
MIFSIFVAAFTLTHNMQLSNFLELEHNDTLENVERVQNVVSAEQEYLDSIVQDWACWDDTYEFIENGNPQYIDVNLQNQTLAGIKINVMIFVNESGDVVYAKSIDIDTAEEVSVPQELLQLIKDGTLLTKAENDTISGFVLLHENPMFISCHPILTTKHQGPVRGTLIFGKLFDNTYLDYFEEVTLSSLSMYRVDKDLPPDFQTKLKFFSENLDKTIVEPLSEERVAGYFGLQDISGKPAIIMRTDSPRELYSHGEKTLNNVYLFLLLTGLVTGAGIKFAFDRLFISRLTGIDNFVTRIRSERDLSQRLSLDNNDELYCLSREINGMLNEIYLAEQELKAQEREKKVLLDSLNELVIFVSSELKIIWVNRAALECMNIELQKAVGMSIKDIPGTVGLLSSYLNFERIFATGNKKSGEFTTDDGRTWYIQAIPVTGEDGKVIGILEMCRDITENKKAEQLRKKEVNHRIKNNLQIVSSLLDLQAEKFSDRKVIEAFKESESRILSMSLIHQELYESGKLDSLDFSSYLHKLITDLIKSYNTKTGEIRVKLDLSTVFFEVDTAVSLGIIINEMFTNSIKYAFPAGAGGEISISLVREESIEEITGNNSTDTVLSESPEKLSGTSKNYKLIYADNGKGFPEEFDFRNPETLGLQLVNALISQIEGSLDLERGNGTKFIIHFKSEL